MEKIKYKFIMDGNGLLSGVELWQGNQHITVSMAAPGTHKNGYRWSEVKDFMDKVQLPVLADPNSEAYIATKSWEKAIKEEN